MCVACDDVMNDVVSVVDGTCTDCDGPISADCSDASCATGYTSFVAGVGCSGKQPITHPLAVVSWCMEQSFRIEVITISPTPQGFTNP
jgi:hypothetical protein